MKKRSKLMIYVRAELAPDAIRWAIRLSQMSAVESKCVTQGRIKMHHLWATVF